MDLLILFGCMVLFFAIGVPIGICLIFPCFLMLLVNPVTSASFLAQSFYTGVASSSMIALPFFMICGNIMDKGGISKRLVNAANNCIGGITGSLGMVTILACMFFGAVSGSAVATVAAIGAIMLPEMVRNGYDKYYATGMCAVAGGLGIIVPPSYPMVVYGITNNESIGDLFIAGLAPAVLVGALLMFVNYLYCKKHGIKGNNKFHLKTALKGFWDAKWALLMPVIILGGIYSGIMTATESAVVATVYGIIIGRFVYKEVTFRQLWDEFRSTATFSGGMMWTVAPATAIGLIFAYLGVNKAIAAFFLGISSNMYIVMFLIVCILFIIGMFMQTTPRHRHLQPRAAGRGRGRGGQFPPVRPGHEPGPGRGLLHAARLRQRLRGPVHDGHAYGQDRQAGHPLYRRAHPGPAGGGLLPRLHCGRRQPAGLTEETAYGLCQ